MEILNPTEMIKTTNISRDIFSVRDLLLDDTLDIPQYQRPYKWSTRNINQLLSDIAIHRNKSSYRLGTVVVHEDEGRKFIVDGQQRTISLLLTVRALIAYRRNGLKRADLKEQLDTLARAMVNPSFESEISKKNIKNNYLEISRIVSRSSFSEDLIDFLLNKCQVVIFGLDNLSEAFQFFDSQNSRGRDLDPHDLLKAYHLREFGDIDAHLMVKTVAHWEGSDAEELAELFSMVLYRIRNWSNGLSARHFGKDDVHVFKGVNIDGAADYPYVRQFRMIHHFVDHYNQQYERKIDGNALDFPFNLDQIIINGRRFFEMISHYQRKISKVRGDTTTLREWFGVTALNGYANEIIEAINTYPGRRRPGDLYVRSIFDCLLIFYVDKFGFVEISRAIEKIFIWAYSLRLKMQVVQLASMDNYVLEGLNLFKLIGRSVHPSNFLRCEIPSLVENRSSKTEAIENLFKQMRYL